MIFAFSDVVTFYFDNTDLTYAVEDNFTDNAIAKQVRLEFIFYVSILFDLLFTYGLETCCSGFSKITLFLELFLMEHISIKNSLDSKLQIYSICSIRKRSRNRAIVEKLQFISHIHNYDPDLSMTSQIVTATMCTANTLYPSVWSFAFCFSFTFLLFTEVLAQILAQNWHHIKS